MEKQPKQAMRREMVLYFLITGVTGLALAMSDTVFPNYFKDVYQIDAVQRGFIEFPRELPGLLCLGVTAALAFMGDIRLAMITQVLSFAGLLVLGLTTPSFSLMLVFLFINSLGMHVYMPLSDSIGMDIIREENVGRRMGQFNAVRTACLMLGGLVVFFGFRYGWLTFKTPVKLVFLIGAALFLVVLVLIILLQRTLGKQPLGSTRMHLVFRREYRFYYMLAILNGAHKQIMYVFGPWVLIELLNSQTDTMSLLSVAASFLGIFFMPLLGRWLDRFGTTKLMMAEALTLMGVYVLFGLLSAGFEMGTVLRAGLPVAAAFALYIAGRISMQFGMVRTVYLKNIAVEPGDITPTLSTGISLDHVVAIAAAAAGGWVWKAWGAQYVFFIAMGLSLFNMIIAAYIAKTGRDAA